MKFNYFQISAKPSGLMQQCDSLYFKHHDRCFPWCVHKNSPFSTCLSFWVLQ